MVVYNDNAILHFKTDSKKDRRKDRTMKDKIEQLEHKIYEFLDDLGDFGEEHSDDLNGKAYEMFDYILCSVDDVLHYIGKMKYELEKEGIIEED